MEARQHRELFWKSSTVLLTALQRAGNLEVHAMTQERRPST